ncbi:MAG TPA: ABC transporter ATP-binding protein, partial [Candidatus Omnitrophica bacterium]|nr:ABC transporter ATP-binding protein [Candidatus Omnitrophota bacterium]
PSAGLSPALVKNTLSLVQQFNQKYGTTVILVEQNVREALQVSRRAFLLKNGQVVSEEHPAKLLANENAIHKLFFN